MLILKLLNPDVNWTSNTNRTIIQSEKYKDFEDVFSAGNAGHLNFNKDHDYSINIVDGKHFSYYLIYSLSKNELLIRWVYIDKNRANRFIRLSKSSAGDSIISSA